MAALDATKPNFLDMMKTMDPGGNLVPIAEVLNATLEIMDDMVWKEGNLTTGHMHSVRTGLPTVTWGQLYKGVLPSKATTAQVTDSTGFLEALSLADKRMVDMHSDPMGYRAQYDRPFVEAMGQEFTRVLFKGTAADTDKFIGLDARFNLTTAGNGENIVIPTNAGGEDTDITSIWLIGWSDRTVFGIVPRNSKMGLQQQDSGIQWIEDGITTGARYQAYQTYFRWDCGLAVPDWRYVVRGANVDIGELTDDAATGVNLPSLMSDMIERLPSDAFGTTRLAFYMNRQLIGKLRKQLMNKIVNSTLTWDLVGPAGALSARRKMHFDGIPVNRVDTLIADETVVA
jgi:hypothetical protein